MQKKKSKIFKSIFLKYISAFMVINLICLGLLSVIITSLIQAYGNENQMRFLKNSSESLKTFVSNDYISKLSSYAVKGDDGSVIFDPSSDYEKNEFGFAVNNVYKFSDYLLDNMNDILPVINLLSDSIDKLLVFITDANGEIYLSGGGKTTILENELSEYNNEGVYSVSEKVMTILSEKRSIEETGNLEGLLKTNNLISAVPVKDNNGVLYGGLFVCTTDTGVDSLLDAMQKTIIMSCLWIMLASLIVTYFISERLVAPLRDMSKAARSFANGDFDVRVEVDGNDEVAELAVAINEMATSLQELEEMRRSFLANVSHDLRTPMTTISGFIDSILDGAIPPDKYDYYLSVIGSEVKRLSRLVVTLLDITKIEAGERKFTPVSFDIAEMARLIMISFEKKIEEKELQIEFKFANERMFVLADCDAIHQVLYNICDNGIKFSREKGRVIIRINELNGTTTVSVYNEGVGIPREDQKYIFDRFYKSDKSRGLDKTGVGLGMYISRTIIEAHKQKIWVESVPGDYCKFSFTLPTSYED